MEDLVKDIRSSGMVPSKYVEQLCIAVEMYGSFALTPSQTLVLFEAHTEIEENLSWLI